MNLRPLSSSRALAFSPPSPGWSLARGRGILAVGVLVPLLAWPWDVQGQGLEVLDNFNSYTNPGDDVVGGWSHYDPGTAGGQTNSWTFPTVGLGDKGYRLYGPASACENLINRGGSYRSEQYGQVNGDFLVSVDIVNLDATRLGSAFFLGGRIAGPGAGTTSGYLAALSASTPQARQGLFTDIAFTSEVNSTIIDTYRGGAALTSIFPASRKLRAVLSGVTNLIKGEIYDSTDLLEPLVKIVFQDGTASASSHASGENLLGWLNLDFNEVCDFTWDNYHATGSRASAVGFPGTPQVVNLVPAPQTLFYTIPTTNKITFTATTFNTNQIATNAMKLFLNDVDVSSQLVFQEVITPLIGSPKTNFTVRWNGSLSSNTVYHGKIVCVDPSGKGTTNNWYFDTFRFFNPTDPSNPSGFLLVEAEDYNYGGGQFQDYPPVSGTDDTTISDDPILDISCVCNPPPNEALGPQVNGGGSGYYDVVGTEDVDYHDNTYQSVDPLTRNQYRTMDRVGTSQPTKGGGGDTPRPYRMGLANNGGGTNSYVPDYFVASMDPGDWMNYTRTFPAANYNVYLRASSQARQDVRMDLVTNPTQDNTNQVKTLVGHFLVPNTESSTRFRYVPLTDGAGNVQTLSLSGTNTFRLTAYQAFKETVLDVGDLQLNWILFVPTSASASSGPWLGYAYPSANSAKFQPDGAASLAPLPPRQSQMASAFGPNQSYGPNAPVTLMILNRGSAVSPGSIQLRFDGVNVTSSATITGSTSEGAGATVTYRPALLLPNSSHTLSLSFSDGSTTRSNQWNFTVDPTMPLLSPSDAAGGLPDTSFAVLVNKSRNGANPTACAGGVTTPWGDTIARAEVQLAGRCLDADSTPPNQPFTNEVAGSTGGMYTELFAVNWEQCSNSAAGGMLPEFAPTVTFYPGVQPPNWDCGGADGPPDHFAVASTIKLQLGPGVFRMGVQSDDQFKVTAGGPAGTNVFLGSSVVSIPGTRNDGHPQFDFAVQTNGIYTFRLVQEEGKGDAHVHWYWVSRTTGLAELVRPLALYSSSKATGPYTFEPGAAIDPSAKTITLPKSGGTRFYRLLSSVGYTLRGPNFSGNNVVLNYQ